MGATESELRAAVRAKPESKRSATAEEMERVTALLEEVLEHSGYVHARVEGSTRMKIRRLVRRMTKLEAELKNLTKNRRTQRRARSRSRLSTVSLVGYTNAGKSTLLNRLTDAGVADTIVTDVLRRGTTLAERVLTVAAFGPETVGATP